MIAVPFAICPGATCPTSAYNSPGIDLYAAEDSWINAGEVGMVRLGVKFAIPAGHVGVLKDRSSFALQGVHVVGGVIDPDFRGEVVALILNASDLDREILRGDKIVQMLVLPCLAPSLAQVSEEDLGATERGEQGFGSSGK